MQVSLVSGRKVTLAEGVAVVLVIALVAFAAMGLSRALGKRGNKRDAAQAMQTIMAALEEYKTDFKSYPPDNYPSDNGSEMIWYYLCRGQTNDGLVYAPYMKVKPTRLVPSNRLGTLKFQTPMGADYQYIRTIDENGELTRYLLLDPGRDQQLGGDLDRKNGFRETGKAKAADNLAGFKSIQPVKK